MNEALITGFEVCQDYHISILQSFLMRSAAEQNAPSLKMGRWHDEHLQNAAFEAGSIAIIP